MTTLIHEEKEVTTRTMTDCLVHVPGDVPAFASYDRSASRKVNVRFLCLRIHYA